MLTFGRIQKYVSPLTGVQNHTTIAIDIANLRWLWAALHTLPRLAELWALIPDDAHRFPILLLRLVDAAVEFVWLASTVFFLALLN
jgi:hypothetical protein